MKRAILICVFTLVSIFGIFLYQKGIFEDERLHVIFCDVGQGDAILVTYGLTQMLIDGGPDKSILSCLDRHMPFWDRKIDIMIATHPQLDHFAGFLDVLDKFSIEHFIHPEVESEGVEWRALKEELGSLSVKERKVHAGNKIRAGKISFDILNPTPNFLGKDVNEHSLVGILSYGEFDVLLTGDIMPPTIDTIQNVRPVEILKVPHHGSKNGLTLDFLRLSDPKIAIISSGVNNRYGHPHEETLKILRDKEIKILRTDEKGEIEIVSDGKKWWVR